MFEDRTDKYDFKKYDQIARTKVMTETKVVESKSEAHKKLFDYASKQEEISTQDVNNTIEKTEPKTSLNNLPSSTYLKQFENQVVDEQVTLSQAEFEAEKQEQTSSEVDYANIISNIEENTDSERLIKKELNKIESNKPQKSFSFRIKLVAGVYCILVALFGGWTIGNAINIAQTNSQISETIAKTQEIDQSVSEIVWKINGLNHGDPDDDSVVVNSITVEISPEEINTPNEYQTKSNWFDVVCNWISGLFGG